MNAKSATTRKRMSGLGNGAASGCVCSRRASRGLADGAELAEATGMTQLYGQVREIGQISGL
jgi:hypothetical protein